MPVEKVTLHFLRELETFSDTEGRYIFDLARKLINGEREVPIRSGTCACVHCPKCGKTVTHSQ